MGKQDVVWDSTRERERVQKRAVIKAGECGGKQDGSWSQGAAGGCGG